MHAEQSVKALFEQVLRQAGGRRVGKIQVALGEIAEITPPQVQNLWNELAQNTPLERAQLEFRLIHAEAQCMACFKKYHPVNGEIHCPNCGSFGAKILSGEEFHVEHIETED